MRRVAAGAGELAVVLEAGMNCGVASWQRVMPLLDSALPLPARWGWRVINAVFPDELHDDAPVALAAIRELRAAARPFPDVPVVVLSAARGFPRRHDPRGSRSGAAAGMRSWLLSRPCCAWSERW